jgi:hypothetical protein
MTTFGLSMQEIESALLSGHRHFDYNVQAHNGKALGCVVSFHPDATGRDGTITIGGWHGSFSNQRNGLHFGPSRPLTTTDTLEALMQAAAKTISASAKRVKGRVTVRDVAPLPAHLNRLDLGWVDTAWRVRTAREKQTIAGWLSGLIRDEATSPELRATYERYRADCRAYAAHVLEGVTSSPTGWYFIYDNAGRNELAVRSGRNDLDEAKQEAAMQVKEHCTLVRVEIL